MKANEPDNQLIWETLKEAGDWPKMGPRDAGDHSGPDPELSRVPPGQGLDRNDALTSLLSYPEEEGADLKNLLAAIDGLMSGAYNLGSNGGEGQSDQFMKALKLHLQNLYPGFDDELINLVHGRISEALADN